MIKLYSPIFLLLIVSIIFISCAEQKTELEIPMMEEKIAQYAETEIKYDESLLDDNQKIVVQKLYEAAKVMDDLFLEQVYSENNKIKEKLKSSNNPEDKKVLEYFKINFGPFDRLDHDSMGMRKNHQEQIFILRI